MCGRYLRPDARALEREWAIIRNAAPSRQSRGWTTTRPVCSDAPGVHPTMAGNGGTEQRHLAARTMRGGSRGRVRGLAAQ
jgi:hypothetical protein